MPIGESATLATVRRRDAGSAGRVVHSCDSHPEDGPLARRTTIVDVKDRERAASREPRELVFVRATVSHELVPKLESWLAENGIRVSRRALGHLLPIGRSRYYPRGIRLDSTGRAARKDLTAREGRVSELLQKASIALKRGTPTSGLLAEIRKLLISQEFGMVRGFEFVAPGAGREVGFSSKPSTSEGSIARKVASKDFTEAAKPAIDTTRLPENPPLWDRDFRGKASGEKDAALLAFLDEVYGPYLPQHRNAMRSYLLTKNPALYASIKAFGFNRLPERLRMPSLREQVQERIQRAAAGQYAEMTRSEQRSVSGATLRVQRAMLKKSL